MIGKFSIEEVINQKPDMVCVICGKACYQNPINRTRIKCTECREKRRNSPAVKKKVAEYVREYNQRPYVKEKLKEYRKKYFSRPEVIQRCKERYRVRILKKTAKQ